MSFKRGRTWFMRPGFLGSGFEITIKGVCGDRVRIHDEWLGKYYWVQRIHLRNFYYPNNLGVLATMDMEELGIE